ncbi:hypothetical protein LR48_Vigan09g086800 [Vigna angularis]|uniref:Uncharacterized protein n=1 Tax=Phaseolus angularis TaxID=3914 RepID=A0A0L9VC18_PHAAN|nr:hypothetical protein LR48_Vigan09g086800 [Vigna angularis]
MTNRCKTKIHSPKYEYRDTKKFIPCSKNHCHRTNPLHKKGNNFHQIDTERDKGNL